MQRHFNPDKADPASGETEPPPFKIHVTFFKDEFATTLTTDCLTLEDLAEQVKCASRRNKTDLPWLKLAVFGTKRINNCLRNDENVVEVSGIEIDYDFEVIAFGDAVAAIKELGIEALIYTSASHTLAKPRWRVLAPFSRHLPPETRAKVTARLNGWLKKKFNADIAKSESFALSQSFFYGWVCDSPKPDHRAEVVHGAFIDLRDDLEAFEANGGPATKADTGAGADAGVIDWAVVDQHLGWLKSEADLPNDFNAKGKAIVAHCGNLKDLAADIACKLTSWSDVVFALAGIFKSDGRYSNEQIAAALFADLDCNQHIHKQTKESQKRRAIVRAVFRSKTEKRPRPANEPIWRERHENGDPQPSMHNARLAIVALGVECKYDTFHNKLLFGYADDNTRHTVERIVGEISDHGIIALRQLMSDKFGFDLTDRHVRDAVTSLALEHCFDPVVDMLDQAEANWDHVARLDKMAAEYFNCEDTKLARAFVRKTMIAAVARARNPGCKKDEVLVLESDEGFNKSSAWRVLAGDENFSDEKIIGKESREVQEQLADVWIHENADLAGMKKAEVETVKAYASRQADIARPAYGHFVKKQKRHSIEIGTTNSDQYLQSQTGNRRFWPVKVLKSIDLEKVRDDRLKLWGEAAHCQSEGESLVLDKSLWAEAGHEQEARRVGDPWEDALRSVPEWVTIIVREISPAGFQQQKELDVRIIHQEKGTDEDRVSAADLLEYVLKIPAGNQRVEDSMRLANTMNKLGWNRPANGYVTIAGKRVKGYFRNGKP